ncbi:SDR family oxidoreductase [Chryseomicrobium palamuruense]|uniref:SDR family oxidoreductase n=1 Tax=Chryseomicrobium palamuruense TaxID=682973 RepID=A0ABV8UU21_9BACL
MNIHERQQDGQPPQTQKKQPGVESKMEPAPVHPTDYKGSGKLKDKVALITGGDSGIGKAVAIGFAAEGAHVVINYLEEDRDAEETKSMIEDRGAKCLLVKGDVSDESFCKELMDKTVKEFGQLDILVNNAAKQFPQNSIEDITSEQWDLTYKTNIYPIFYLSKLAMPHLKQGSSIINTTSVTTYMGNKELIDYASTKGAIVGFTRSLAQNVADKGIRVNMVAPGPIWTPLIPATFDEKHVEEFGTDTPLGRPGQPRDLVGAYVLLASEDGAYMTGQCIHVNGGMWMSS